MIEQKKSIRVEDKPKLDRVKNALAKSGLECASIEEYPTIGFENPEKGYAIFVGGVLPQFKGQYHKTLQDIPREYYLTETMFSRGGSYQIKPEKRDILARRIMLKQAINSLDTKIEEQSEEERMQIQRLQPFSVHQNRKDPH